MYIAGQEISSDTNIDVINPFSNNIVASVPAATREQVSEAFRIGSNYQPKLTRYERQQILQKTAELLVKNKDEISNIITEELGISNKIHYMRWVELLMFFHSHLN